jgi:hypothetical protein
MKNMHYQAWYNASYTATAVWGGSKLLPDLKKIMETSAFNNKIPESDEANELIILNIVKNIQNSNSDFNITITDIEEEE